MTPKTTLAERAIERRLSVVERKIRRGEDEDAIDREYFRSIGPKGRGDLVWTLTVSTLLLGGYNESQLRLDRSVGVLRKK